MRVTGSPVANLEQMRWVGDYPAYGAARFPGRAAIVDDSQVFSYAELERASAGFAAYLAGSGVKAGERIAYLGKNSASMFPVLFGCLRAGVVLVPLNWRYAARELGFVLADAQPVLLIHSPEFADTVAQAIAGLPAPPRLLCTEGEDTDGETLRAAFQAAPVPSIVRPAALADACAIQLYTSGTTGQPKGVMLSYRAISIARWIEIDSPHWTDWNDDDVILSAMPNFHSGGLAWMLIGLLRSLTCVLTADASPANLLALSRRHGVTRTFVVPVVVKALIELVEASSDAPPPLKQILYGAAPMSVDLIRRCMAALGGSCCFAQFYGMTEASGSVTFFPPKAHDLARPDRLRSVGTALPGFEIEIRGPDGAVLDPGQPGEIWVRSPTTMIGYWNKPEASAEVLVGGWYRTGDGGWLDDDGYLYITDRIKDMIISGGENIYPAEVEQALRQHPAVNEVVVVGAPDARWGEIVVAFVEWRPGRSASLEELQAFARTLVAGYKLPRRLHGVDLLPRTPTGKLQRGEVRKRLPKTGA